MSDTPVSWHPVSPAEDGDGLDVDTSLTVDGWQITPATWDGVAAWCGGTQVWNPRGVALGSLDPGSIAYLGDYVMHTAPTVWEVSRADGHYQRWALAEPDAA